MSKNVIHNFDIKIKNSANINTSEELAKTFVKELTKVSIEKKEQKDIVQLWQEQKNQNAEVLNNSNTLAEEGVFGTSDGKMRNPIVLNNTTSSASEGITSYSNFSEPAFFATSITAPIEGGASDNSGRIIMNSSSSVGITPSIMGAENDTLSSILTSKIYSGITQQNLSLPENHQSILNEPSIEVIKKAINKKLENAVVKNDLEAENYWKAILEFFNEGASISDFDGKPEHVLFTEMYADLKQLNSSVTAIRNFNWEIVRKKMIEAIDANILSESISKPNKERWEKIKKELSDDKTNIANLFERYDELFLLLKEVEGLDVLPASINITTKTKIYPNLSADKLYAAIGKENVYVFLREITETNFRGSAVNKGAVKIKNTEQISFIAGESLEFFVDEAFIKQSLYQKENINWVVYNDDKKTKNIFKNEGTTFNYNFDTPGKYKVDAYGYEDTVKGKKSAVTSTFIELEIIAQDIIIQLPTNIKGEFTRPFTEEKNFKISLKNSTVKTINPLKLYYQIETAHTGKTIVISDEQELDTLGIIKLAMPDLGIYKIKVFSKDQYGLVKEFKTSVIKNEVMSIGLADKESNNVFLLGNPNRTTTLEAKNFKINPPTDEEKEDVKWIIYDSDNKPYLAPGIVIFANKKDSQKAYIHKWNSFEMSIPQKEGHYIVEAFSDRQKGVKSGAIFKIEVKQPKIAEAYWAWSGGSKKASSGFSGESNWIEALIPHYENQKVRVYFYLNNKKTTHYIDVKTNKDGKVFEEIKFDTSFQKAIGFQNTKSTKIGFKLLGIQNGKPYPFIAPANYETDTILSVSTDKKILDVYFVYDGKRVIAEDEVPFGKNGAIVSIVAKTQNMIGEEVTLTATREDEVPFGNILAKTQNMAREEIPLTTHKVSEKPSFAGKAKVSSQGVATISFTLFNLNKKLKEGSKVNYYAGVEGYSTTHLTNKVLVMNVGEGKKKNMIDLTWGAKVSQEFREKVIEICEDLWPDNTDEMANGLMAVMYRETNKTFAANQLAGYKSLIPRSEMTKKHFENINKETGEMRSRAIGLIQFTQAALVSMKEFTNGEGFDKLHKLKLEYANMTDVKQLDKVRKYFKNVVRLPKVAEDIYVAVFSPDFVSKKGSDTLYKKGTINYSSNPGLDKNNDGIQKSELLVKYYESFKEGNKSDNIASVALEKKEIVKSKFVNVHLHFTGVTASEASLSNKTKNILKEVGDKTKNFNIYITSTARNTYDQARIMYQNCSQSGGVKKQRKIYKAPGNKVIDVYVNGIELGNRKEEVILAMENKIKDLGPSTVSAHIADFDKMNTFDISYNLLSNKNDFLNEIKKLKELNKVLIENDCYHIQINQ